MPERNQKRHRLGLALLLAVLLLGYCAYGVYLSVFNNTSRSYRPGETNAPISLLSSPRTGQTDSWIKRIDENGQTVPYYGAIYDHTLINQSPYTLSDWSMTVRVSEDCFLNNAWCGTVEVHQFTDGQERVQTVDLRDYGELTLLYRVEGPDLLIPLHAGDWLLYTPSISAMEYPLEPAGDHYNTEVVFGMILYTQDDHALGFPQIEVRYRLHMDFLSSWCAVVLLILSGIWFVLLCVVLSVDWNMRKAHQRFRQDERIIRQSIGVYTHFFEAKDTYTTGHSQRVADYSDLIAHKLGLSDDVCRKVYYTALMHDCGKCYIPDEILKKPGKLTDEEYEIIKSHTVRGGQMVEDMTAIDCMHDGVLYHHERFDGRGYPTGLAGEQIPLVSRIICISDSFDAMNSCRCYRNKLSRERILSELRNGAGKQFDPTMVKLMLALIDEGKVRFSEDAGDAATQASSAGA